MRKVICYTVICLGFLGVVTVWAADVLTRPPIDAESSQMKFEMAALEYGADIDFIEHDETRYEVEMKANIKPQQGLDLVCFSEHVQVVSATDANGKSLVLPEKRKRSGSKGQKFAALLEGAAETELEKALFITDPYKIHTMEVSGTAVICKLRKEVLFNHTVTKGFTELIPGLSVRVMMVEVKRGGKVKVKVDVKRRGGIGNPFLESVLLVDRSGTKLGGSRWHNKADLAAGDYYFEAEFVLTQQGEIDQLMFHIVMESEIRPVAFQLSNLFPQ